MLLMLLGHLSQERSRLGLLDSPQSSAQFVSSLSCIAGSVVTKSLRDVTFPLLGDALLKPWLRAAAGRVDGCLLPGREGGTQGGMFCKLYTKAEGGGGYLVAPYLCSPVSFALVLCLTQ